MKKILLTIFALLASICLIGCGDESDGKTVVEFWHMSPVGSASYTGMKNLINDFNKSQDEIYVKGTGFGFWDYWDKISIAIASNTAPAIGLSTVDDVPARAKSGKLYNISELIANDESDNNIDLSEFRQSQMDFATYNGKLYAMPFTATTRVLYYNKDLFADAGLTDADVPTTWSELAIVAKKLNKSSGNTINQLGFDPSYGNATYHGWLWQNGLDFFDDDLNVTLNTQKHVDILNWIVKFNSEFTRNQLNDFGEATSLLGVGPFTSERVAMIVESDGLYQTIKDAGATFNFGVAQIPIPDEDGINVNWGSGFGLEMYNNLKTDEVKKAATWEFYKYLFTEEIQLKLAQINGWLMSHKSAMQAYVAGDPIRTKLLEQVDFAVDKRYVPYAPSWHGNDWQPFYDDALSERKTPAKALEEARAHYIQKKENYDAVN